MLVNDSYRWPLDHYKAILGATDNARVMLKIKNLVDL